MIDVEFQGMMGRGGRNTIPEKLNTFNYEFLFGASYLLNCKPGEGGWALSWIVGGLLKPTSGIIRLNETNYLLKDAWGVRESEIKRWGFGNQPVEYQIKTGLKSNARSHLTTEDEIMKRFHLTPERYKRPLHQLSHEAWRASCAIGYASGKKIFCFPYLSGDFINTYYDLWLKDLIDLLRDTGALVLVPADLADTLRNLCDVNVSLR
ncbi:MAG TPA: hypothetical protein VHL11_02745 [Phototrophicaceae bacterium]|nr:hypothetical protein [Phototrophicaceae bacterium]